MFAVNLSLVVCPVHVRWLLFVWLCWSADAALSKRPPPTSTRGTPTAGQPLVVIHPLSPVMPAATAELRYDPKSPPIAILAAADIYSQQTQTHQGVTSAAATSSQEDTVRVQILPTAGVPTPTITFPNARSVERKQKIAMPHSQPPPLQGPPTDD